MEKQLFDWKRWDEQDFLVIMFYETVLKQKIGMFDIGTKFSSVCVNYQLGIITFYNLNIHTQAIVEYEFKLELKIVA